MSEEIKLMAVHLPQFHPFAENDEWWGKGFTEWTNVTKSKPRFKGHYQPHLPSDLGFYDLRLEDSRIAQAELAKEYGIHGFCYYHYWFNGQRLMNKPLDDLLKSTKPDFPFMLCWANENWSRRWDGQDAEMLIKQEYGFDDDREHIRFLIQNFFADKRYIRVDGKPFFAVYRPSLFPDIKRTTDIWREEAQKAGLPGLHIGYFQAFSFYEAPEKIGFDCVIEFPPHKHAGNIKVPSFWDKVLGKFGFRENKYEGSNIANYHQLVSNSLNNIQYGESLYPGVMPNWDNSARRKVNPYMSEEATPELYGQWLANIIKEYKKHPYPNKFIFINAWNEWAEGNHLEPCQKWGRKYLEITKEIVENQDGSLEKWEHRSFYNPKRSWLGHAFRKVGFILKAILLKLKIMK